MNSTHLIIVVVVVVVFIIMQCKSPREGMENMTAGMPRLGHNPRMYQPAIDREVDNDNFIRLPNEAQTPWAKNKNGYGETDYLDDGAMGNAGLNFNMCSKACCSQQYPPPFSITPDDFVLRSGKEFVPSSYTCNNGWQDSGCVCMTKDQALFLNKRGNNAYNEI